MIKIGICGFGTVGQSLVKHLSDHKDLIINKTSLEFEIAYIDDRSIHKKTYPKNIPDWLIKNYDNLLTSCVKK